MSLRTVRAENEPFLPSTPLEREHQPQSAEEETEVQRGSKTTRSNREGWPCSDPTAPGQHLPNVPGQKNAPGLA